MNDNIGFNLDKMDVKLIGGMAHYEMQTNDGPLLLNDLLGKSLRLNFHREIYCTHCNKKTNKSYSGGYCYVCSIKLAECDMCILKPETCHYSLGTCRDPKWGEKNCMTHHYVYLANSSGLKVGITRASQVPTRFIDQGAVRALPIIKVGSRHMSGVFEKLFASEYKDKTDWRKMLKGDQEFIDLQEKRDELFELFGEDLDQLEHQFGEGQVSILEQESEIEIHYPVISYPEKVTSLSVEKLGSIGGTLKGIKGQYLLFDTGVINIRSHTGYRVHLEF